METNEKKKKNFYPFSQMKFKKKSFLGKKKLNKNSTCKKKRKNIVVNGEKNGNENEWQKIHGQKEVLPVFTDKIMV